MIANEHIKGWLQIARPPIRANKYEKAQFYESINNAIDAVDKQIPKKPVICSTTGGEKGYMCIACYRMKKKKYIDGYVNYCEFCGQAIDFEGVEEWT